MTLLTRTGLLEGRRKPIVRRKKELEDLEAPLCQAAPYSLRPLAALLNPYARGCSVLCNHPADSHSKDALRRIKETWPTEMRGGLLTGEGADDTLPEELFRRYTDTDSRPHSPPPPPVVVAQMGPLPLPLRRCRTPDPNQRDQHQEGQRTLLVLDLRRSRSHDTLSMAAPSESGIWPGSALGAVFMSPTVPSPSPAARGATEGPSGQGPPSRRSGPVPVAVGARRGGRAARTPRTPCPSLAASRPASQATCRPGSRSRPPRPASQPSGSGVGAGLQALSQPPSPVPRSKSQGEATEDPGAGAMQPVLVVTCAASEQQLQAEGDPDRDKEDDSSNGVVRRRGKKRRGKRSGKDSLREPEKEIHGFPEPGETQVSAMGDEVPHASTSARPSLTGLSGVPGLPPGPVGLGDAEAVAHARAIEASFLDAESLHHLQRDLDQETVECEFDAKRRVALEEAYRLLPPRATRRDSQPEVSDTPPPAQPLSLSISVPHSGLLGVPRVFSLRSARFELPLDTKLLDSLTPLEYVTRHVEVCHSSAQLYRRVFNRHREGADLPQHDQPKYLLGENVVAALGGVLGRPLTEAEVEALRDRLGWQKSDQLGFRTWCGVCALAERLLAPRDSRVRDRGHPAEPRPELEQADLAGLQRRLARLPNPDPRLVRVLTEVSFM